jgi:cell division protein FtsQ
MTNLASVSRTELTERRQKLRRQRRLKVVQASWRTLAVSGLAGGLVWGVTLPAWTIRVPEQIAIDGNEFLSEEAVQALLPVAYPQHLLQLQPQALAGQLKSQAFIADATITRHLFPPGLTVQVQERRPVAVLLEPDAGTAGLADSSEQSAQSTVLPGATQIKLLDETGISMPLVNYSGSNQSPLPSLRVVGMPRQYLAEWSKLYQQVSRSPIAVIEIDWRDPANLILKTDLGVVHLGSYSSQFSKQLNALNQMRELPEIVDTSQIDYIDLRNPDNPSLHMIETSAVPEDTTASSSP